MQTPHCPSTSRLRAPSLMCPLVSPDATLLSSQHTKLSPLQQAQPCSQSWSSFADNLEASPLTSLAQHTNFQTMCEHGMVVIVPHMATSETQSQLLSGLLAWHPLPVNTTPSTARATAPGAPQTSAYPLRHPLPWQGSELASSDWQSQITLLCRQRLLRPRRHVPLCGA